MGASAPTTGDQFWHRGEPFPWLTEAPAGDRFWYQGDTAAAIPLVSDRLLPSGIVSAQAFGQPQVQLLLQIVTPTGITSAQALGQPLTQLLLQIVTPTGITSAQALGQPLTQLLLQIVTPTGITSMGASGQPLVRLRPRLQPLSIRSEEKVNRVNLGRRFLCSWDLHLESDVRSRFHNQLEEIAPRLGSVQPEPPEVQTIPQTPRASAQAESLQNQMERLESDATLLEEHTVQLIEQVRLKASRLRFAVPPDNTAVRAALLALHLNPETISFDNYLELLNLQISLAQQASQHLPNETTIHASGQAEIAVAFFESQLKNEISEASAWATQAKPLVKTRYTAGVVKNHLANYQNFPTNNTIINAMGGKASLADILRDCIPCLERTLSLNGINPFEQFLALLQSEITRRWAYIQGLWNILNGRYLNICDLLNFLNSLCIPDLFALLAVLAYYWLQLMQLMELNVWKLLWSLIQPLLQSLLCGLEGLLEQFIRLLLAPVECIITSIDHEYSKLYNLGRALSKEFWTKGPQATKPYDHSFEKWAKENITNPVLYGVGPYGMGLLELKRALLNARDMINGQLKRLQDAIKETLGVDADALGSSQGLFLVLRWIALLIGLIKAIIRFKQSGYSCKPEGLDKQQYQVLVDYLNETTDTPFIITPVVPPVFPGQDQQEWPPGYTGDASEFLQDLLKNLGFDQLFSTVSLAVSETASATAAYHLPDCVAHRSELEAARTAAWVKELDKLVP